MLVNVVVLFRILDAYNRVHEEPGIIAVYRSGQKICNLGDDIDDFFKGLPKLTQKIKEIKDAYEKINRDRA